MRRVLPAYLLGVLFACTRTEVERTGAGVSPIVGGGPAGAQATPVLQLGVGGSCTGTLVAPNLVLTAKHCVADVIGASYNCDENGNVFVDWEAGVVDVTPDAGSFGAVHSLDKFSIGPSGTSPFAPHVARVLVAPGSTLCKTDIALLVLDRAVDDPTLAPIRVDHAPPVGEHLTAIGWGFVTGKDYPTTLQQRDVKVLAVGPAPQLLRDAGAANGAVPPNFYEIGEGLCHGDSGSPALAASGAVVGVASGVDNPDLVLPSGTAADCVGSSIRGIYEATAAEKDFLLSGFAAAKAVPWLEGEADPRARLKDFQADCANDEECKSNVCVLGGDAGSRCSHGCLGAADACPGGYRCAQVDARMRCLPVPPAGTGSDLSAPVSASGGCSVSKRAAP